MFLLNLSSLIYLSKYGGFLDGTFIRSTFRGTAKYIFIGNLFFVLIGLLTFALPLFLRKLCRDIILVLSAVIMIAEVFFLLCYGVVPDTAFIEALLATNTQEAWDFIKTYVLQTGVLCSFAASTAIFDSRNIFYKKIFKRLTR